jgi:hypothetical protein
MEIHEAEVFDYYNVKSFLEHVNVGRNTGHQRRNNMNAEVSKHFETSTWSSPVWKYITYRLAIEPFYETALLHSLSTIQFNISHTELAIQSAVAVEIGVVEGALEWSPCFPLSSRVLLIV